MERTEGGCVRRVLVVVALIIVTTLICATIMTLVLDQQCAQQLPALLPLYPDAQIVSEEHNFLRPFGIGATTMTLYTPDAPNEVQRWYQRETERGAASYSGLDVADAVDWTVSEAENGVGSQIVLYASCGV